MTEAAELPEDAHVGVRSAQISLAEATTSVDPAAVYRGLRERYGNVAPVWLEPGVAAWLVMGYEELRTITKQETLYSRDGRNWRDWQDGTVAPDSELGPMMFYRDNVIGADLTKHRRLRRPLDDGVAAVDQRAMRRAVRAKCAELIASFSGTGHADLVADYAAIVPMLAIAGLFGLNTGEGHELRAALIALFSSGSGSQDGNRAFEEILADLLHARQAAPADDLTTRFIDHPDLHDDSEILQAIVVMISAGNETSTIWIAQTLRLMLTDRRFAARVRGGRLGIDEALDEVLWADPPMNNMPARYALRDTTLGGQHIRRGDALILGLAAAGADPRLHPRGAPAEPGNVAHLAWSAGPHACPARIPARVIARTAVETVLNLLPGISLDIPAEQIRVQPSPWTRCPDSLPVTFPPPVRPAGATAPASASDPP